MYSFNLEYERQIPPDRSPTENIEERKPRSQVSLPPTKLAAETGTSDYEHSLPGGCRAYHWASGLGFLPKLSDLNARQIRGFLRPSIFLKKGEN